MDHARNKLVSVFILLLSLTSCTSRTPEEWLVNHLEEKYANLYVNGEPAKRAVIQELKTYFVDHKLNDENIDEVKKIIHKIGDGHVVIFDDRKEKNLHYTSGIVFFPGSNFIKDCDSCKPALKSDVWQIEEINNISLHDYLEKNKYSVAASTPRARDFRVLRGLQENTWRPEISLKLKSMKGKIITTSVSWIDPVKSAPDCVRGVRINENTFKIIVSSLWCEDSSKGNQDRLQIYENFRNQFNQAINEATQSDRIILDLRENGGGGDYEVEYVLNAFFSKSVFMYHYKYLRKTEPGKRKHLEKYWPFKLDVWAKDEFQYTELSHKPKKQFYDNKVTTLISPGCFSSCETIASTLKLEKRSKLIGSLTHGGSGDPVIFSVTGTHYSINLPACVTWQENNEYFEGVGVAPDLTVSQNHNSLEDDVLNAAIDPVR